IGGHRGDQEVAPENTMAAFEAAVACGVDYIETDVHRSADGVLVIIHDDTLDRTTNGSGAVANATLEELLRLDAGGWFGDQHRDQRILTLDRFLAWLDTQNGIGAVIEAKATGVGGELAERIAASPVAEHLALCSFLPDEIIAAK